MDSGFSVGACDRNIPLPLGFSQLLRRYAELPKHRAMQLPHSIAYRMWSDALERLGRDTPMSLPHTLERFDAAAVRAFAEVMINCRRSEDLKFLCIGRKYQYSEFLGFVYALQRKFDDGFECAVEIPADVKEIRPLEILGRIAFAFANRLQPEELGRRGFSPCIQFDVGSS